MAKASWKLFVLILLSRVILDNLVIYREYILSSPLLIPLNLFHALLFAWVTFGWLFLFDAQYSLPAYVYLFTVMVVVVNGLWNKGCILTSYTKRYAPGIPYYGLYNLSGLSPVVAAYVEMALIAIGCAFAILWLLQKDYPLFARVI